MNDAARGVARRRTQCLRVHRMHRPRPDSPTTHTSHMLARALSSAIHRYCTRYICTPTTQSHDGILLKALYISLSIPHTATDSALGAQYRRAITRHRRDGIAEVLNPNPTIPLSQLYHILYTLNLSRKCETSAHTIPCFEWVLVYSTWTHCLKFAPSPVRWSIATSEGRPIVTIPHLSHTEGTSSSTSPGFCTFAPPFLFHFPAHFGTFFL
mmetsp:Transcript_24361/g.60589  ORF Transcript_24361/g.60589 Transcript_24361/m.60589 type:complete len:211 (+) Transcript_24361:1195-1827(+)